MVRLFLVLVLSSSGLLPCAASPVPDRVPIPGTPGFEAKVERRGGVVSLVVLVPQSSFPAGAGTACISALGEPLCSGQMGPYGQEWDAPRAFYFRPPPGVALPPRGSLSILSESGTRLANFEVDLGGVARLLRD